MQLPSASTSNLFRGSGNEMSGALGVNPVDAMLGPPPQRAQDLDLAIKLERKLQEVQKKLERQGSARSGDSGSSYSLGEIERGISASPVRNEEGIRKEGGRVVVEVKEVGGKSFAVERGVVVLR
jgi:hypothetical protein